MVEVVAVNKKYHKNHKIRTEGNFLFAKNDTICPIILMEVRKIVKQSPIVFIVDKHKTCNVFAMQGLNNHGNHFVTESGQWKTDYVPYEYRKYPFLLANTTNSEEKVLCVLKETDIITADADIEGHILFDQNSEPSEYLTKIVNFLQAAEENKVRTKKAVSLIQEFNLLEELNIKIKTPDQEKDIKGLLKIDVKKFAALDQNSLVSLKNSYALDLIYGHFFSMENLSGLVNLGVEDGSKDSKLNTSLKDRAQEKQKVENKKELDNLVKNLLIED